MSSNGYENLVDPAGLNAAYEPAYAAATAEGLRKLLAPRLLGARRTQIEDAVRSGDHLAFILSSTLVAEEVQAIAGRLGKGRYEPAYAYRVGGPYPGTRTAPAWVFGPADLRLATAVPRYLKGVAAATLMTFFCVTAAYLVHATRYV